MATDLLADTAEHRLRPILKWAGGKQWLAPALAQLFRMSNAARLIEPFAGGAALYFSAAPQQAILADTNTTLITTYQAIAHQPGKVSNELNKLTIDSETFYAIRSQQPSHKYKIAARMLYLNRTAFGGLWRVNARGEFNVPFGCKPETKLPSSADLRAYSHALINASFHVSNFEETLAEVSSKNDFVFCDPPYTVAHNNNGFLRYNEHIFRWDDQIRLASLCNEIAQGGGRVVVSNAAHHDVVRLYDRRLFHGFIVARNSNLASQPKYRTKHNELLLVSKSVGLTRQGVARVLHEMDHLHSTLINKGMRW